MVTFHTFGDSHSFFGWNKIKNIKCHHIGPILCYSFGQNRLRIDITNKTYEVNKGDIICFCLGEIDCRCHIQKYINIQKYEEIIDKIIANYFKSISLFNVDNKICIFNVVPPVEKNNVVENKDYPFLGTDDDRKKYVLYFNKILKEQCKHHNYIYIDVYNDYIDNNGYLKKDLSDGNVHIKNPVFIENVLKKEFKNIFI